MKASASICLACGALGLPAKLPGGPNEILWYRWVKWIVRGKRRGELREHPDPFARAPWPYATKSPYCPECWARIVKAHPCLRS